MPPAQPTEVKIIAVPSAAAPAEVKIVSTPPDESAHAMVQLTQWLVGANILLCGVTVWSTLKQGRNQKRRDLATMRREVNRAANKSVVGAIRLGQMALLVPQVRNHMHVLIGQGGMPTTVRAEIENELQIRRQRLQEISDASFAIGNSDLAVASEDELTRHLWRLDEYDEQLEGTCDAITDELRRYETEAATLRQNRASMQAAALGAKLQPQR